MNVRDVDYTYMYRLTHGEPYHNTHLEIFDGCVCYWYCVVVLLLRLPFQHKVGVNGEPDLAPFPCLPAVGCASVTQAPPPPSETECLM